MAVVAVVGGPSDRRPAPTWEAALVTLTTAYWARQTNCAEPPKAQGTALDVWCSDTNLVLRHLVLNLVLRAELEQHRVDSVRL